MNDKMEQNMTKYLFTKRLIALVLCLLVSATIFACTANTTTDGGNTEGEDSTQTETNGKGNSVSDYGEMNENEWDENK